MKKKRKGENIMKKKLLALILAATMAFPVCAFADDAEEETATDAVA